jgi:hypothetical protein
MRPFFSVLWLILPVLVCGCGGGIETVQEAGSTHVAVLSVARWDDYQQAVQPAFSLTPQQAMDQSVPNIADVEGKLLDTLSASASVTVPGATSASGDSGSAKGSSSPSSASGNSKSTDGSAPATQPAIGLDPLQHYWAATALWQEVQLINVYVKAAAVDREQFVPYLVRLQVTLLPIKRHEPLDAYTTISFFRGDFPTTQPSYDNSQAASASTSPDDVRIIPLLVTDDIQTALESKSVERVRQLALTLAAAIHGIGASGSFSDMNDKLQSVLGNDFDSTFTVARVSSNTLRVRFGAQQHPNADGTLGYEMVPETHAVTLVVLVPIDQAQSPATTDRILRLVSQTSMVNAITGAYLPGRASHPYDTAVQQILAEESVKANNPASANKARKSIETDIAENNYQKFYEDFGTCYSPRINLDYLWSDLVLERGKDPYQTGLLVVPQVQSPALLDDPGKLNFVANDSGQQLQVLVDNGVGLYPDAVASTLQVKTSDGAVLLFPATQMTGTGTTLLATFPSPKALNLKLASNDPVQLELRASRISSTTKPADAGEYPLGAEAKNVSCYYVAIPPPETVPFAMNVTATSIAMDSSNGGTLNLYFTKVTNPVKVSISGADVVVASPAAIANSFTTTGEVNVTSPGVVTLSLSNLSANGGVTIAATDSKTKSTIGPIKLSVVSAAGGAANGATTPGQTKPKG